MPNLKHRQAIAAALDRAQIRTIHGGNFAGDLADGVIKPNLPADYAPSGMWTGLLGEEIPDTGDPEYAKQLIEESGEPMPTDHSSTTASTPERNKEAASMVASLGKAGIKVKPNPIEVGQYYSIVFDPAKAGHIMWAGWGPDWPNASTVIPELFTQAGGFNLSQVDDKAFNAKVAGGQGQDRPRGSVRAVEGAEQGGHAERVGHPDPVRPLAAAGRLEGQVGLR